MRTGTLLIFFFGILLLTGTAKYATNSSSMENRKSNYSPWGEPFPSHNEEMLQKQEDESEEEDRYDIGGEEDTGEEDHEEEDKKSPNRKENE